MITLGATFGTGLLVGSGTALYEGGPLGILIAFAFVGFICYCMMTSLCEMATFLPHKKGFVGFASRYIHPAVGFGLGWTYVFQFLFVPASHINTAAIVMEYSGYTISLDYRPVGSSNPVPVAVWRLIFIILAVSINFLGIRGFGRFEFWLSSFKILVLIALIFFGIVVDLGGARLKPGHPSGNFDRLGFRYWSGDFGPMGHAPIIKQPGSLNTFLGFWATMVRAWFSYMGIELLGVVVGEAANPRKSVPRAIKQTYRLVISLYMLNIFIIGLICPSNDRVFYDHNPFLSHEGQVSPFIIAANQLAARGLVPVMNAAIIIFALSGATSNVYTASRILYGLALDKQAPSILRKVTAGGKPLLAIGIAMACCFFSYLGQDEGKTTSAFDYFVDLTTTAGAISWVCILWSHIRFRGALKAQRYQMDTLRYLSPMYPYGTWFSLIATIIFTIFKGHESYQKRGAGGFIAAYILIPWFLFLTGMWKYLRNETSKPLNRIDLIEGKREVDLAEESYYQWKSTHGNPSIWDKIMARA
ncbi:putative DIP5-glutamate and aspartate permease [Serendipita vermifera]|nr:putative DIP5-glutamate and aspartate permease [Serendipita vermifera]